MNNLLTAIMTKLTGSALDTAVSSRIYLDEAPEATVFPYVVFSIVSSVPADTFAEQIDDALVQFDLYSTDPGATQISGLYENLRTALKDQTLTVTGGTNLWCEERNLTTLYEDITTLSGTVGARHWAVDYGIGVKRA